MAGLTQAEADNRLKEYGPNELVEKNKATPLSIFLRQFKNNFVVYLLFTAAIISLAVGKGITGYVILGVIAIVIVVGFFLEYRAEKSLQALKDMITRITTVVRDGQQKNIPSRELVVGDIVLLKNGDYIPADCKIIDQKELYVNESVLTGESKEVSKNLQSQDEEERSVFMGTYIVNGKATVEVLKTGMDTRFGNIAQMISKTEKEMPLQSQINGIIKYMITIALSFSILTGILMALRAPDLSGETLIEILIVVIALSVSAVPEGLPVVLITTLATGATRMAKKNAIVNRMSAIGTIGEVTVICSDKTGTITKGEMTVKKVITLENTYDVTGGGYAINGEITQNDTKVDVNKDTALQTLLKTGALCNDARISDEQNDGEYKTQGTPTEVALIILGRKAGIEKEDYTIDRKEEVPFSSSRKIMSILGSDNYMYSKGAPEVIISKSTHVQLHNDIVPFTDEHKVKIEATLKDLASNAYRTLALAYKEQSNILTENDENNLIFLGLVAIEDPPREEVKLALQECFQAGIQVKMITGDNKDTAAAVAHAVGLSGNILEGHELDTISDRELTNTVKDTAVFARVRPEHKVRIVQALKRNNEIVAMTGDGVNDAPALKEAHVGIAMGKNGTDVSRSVADITLKDDNFATIVVAVREGRGIFENIRTFVSYQLSSNLAQLCIIFVGVLLAPVLGWQVPLLVSLQILFINLITDSLPATTLGLIPPAQNIMNRSPHRKGLMTPYVFKTILFVGTLTTITVLGVYGLYKNILGASHPIAQSTAFTTFICVALANAFNFRSVRGSILNQFTKENKLLFFAMLLAFSLTLLMMYTPLDAYFEVVPLAPAQWGIIGAAVLFVVSCFEVYKALQRPRS